MNHNATVEAAIITVLERRLKYMVKLKQYLKISIAALCVILILAYAFIVFMPHSHGVCDSGCLACSLIEKAKNTLFAALCFAAIFQILHQGHFVSGDYYKLSVKDGTPVGLRVKLSN